MVEAAGQMIWPFRARLDYAITPANLPGAGRVIDRDLASSRAGQGNRDQS
jgi:hypothetical protein